VLFSITILFFVLLPITLHLGESFHLNCFSFKRSPSPVTHNPLLLTRAVIFFVLRSLTRHSTMRSPSLVTRHSTMRSPSPVTHPLLSLVSICHWFLLPLTHPSLLVRAPITLHLGESRELSLTLFTHITYHSHLGESFHSCFSCFFRFQSCFTSYYLYVIDLFLLLRFSPIGITTKALNSIV
jgi:hypothetical protein